MNAERIVTFHKSPSSRVERDIAELLENFLTAYNRKDANSILNLLDETATVDSLTVNKKVGLEEYRRVLNDALLNLKTAKLHGTAIWASDQETIVKGILEVRLLDNTMATNMYRLQLRKREGIWKIVDVQYLTRHRPM